MKQKMNDKKQSGIAQKEKKKSDFELKEFKLHFPPP